MFAWVIKLTGSLLDISHNIPKDLTVNFEDNSCQETEQYLMQISGFSDVHHCYVLIKTNQWKLINKKRIRCEAFNSSAVTNIIYENTPFINSLTFSVINSHTEQHILIKIHFKMFQNKCYLTFQVDW